MPPTTSEGGDLCSPQTTTVVVVVSALFRLYEQQGKQTYIGEDVDVLTHSLLTARQARCYAVDDDEVILAAFFHDLGHLVGAHEGLDQMGDWGTSDHDTVGATYLQECGFSPRVCSLVAHHVAAKRYLVATQPGYRERLSEASRQTLLYQGEGMSAEECARFEADPLREIYVKFREWEEGAKGPIDDEDRESWAPVFLAQLQAMAIDHLNTTTTHKKDLERQ